MARNLYTTAAIKENIIGRGGKYTNRETDYQADQVWTTRTEAGYFETKKYVIHNRDSLIQHAFQSSTEEGFVSQVISLTPQDLEKDSNLDYLKRQI